MGAEIYWEMRRAAGSVGEFVERYYPGQLDQASYLAMWQQGNAVDVALEESYRYGGYGGVAERLGEGSAVEFALNSLAANWHFMTTGDEVGARSLLAASPAAWADVMPRWAQDQAAQSSKLQYQAAERAAAGWGGPEPRRGLTTTTAPAVRRREAKGEKAKAKTRAKVKARAKGTPGAEE